jgi:four helix bundle protein
VVDLPVQFRAQGWCVSCFDQAVAESMICVRSFEFAGRIFKTCERLWHRGPAARHVAQQLMRCGTSVGANAEEAQDAQTKADFVARLSISRKEAREALYWLRLAVHSGAATAAEIEWELKEIGEIRAMLVAAIRTARASPSRGQSLPNS